MANFVKFRGHLYRKAQHWPKTTVHRPHWGPDKWPSDEYLSLLEDKPPLTREEYDFLVEQKADLGAQIGDLKALLAEPEPPGGHATLERLVSKLERGTREIENQLVSTDRWLYENNPRSFGPKRWASLAKKS